jgi:nuclear transport factor 2 (NTF2) superfamily protein
MEKTTGGGMSPRIQELALESGAWHQVYGNRNFMIDEHFDIEKFARLIVRECIAQCNDGDSRWFITQHFGIEE